MKQTRLFTPQEYYPELDRDLKIRQEYRSYGIYDNSVNWAMMQALDDAHGMDEFRRISGKYSYYSDDDAETKEKKREYSAKEVVKVIMPAGHSFAHFPQPTHLSTSMVA